MSTRLPYKSHWHSQPAHFATLYTDGGAAAQRTPHMQCVFYLYKNKIIPSHLGTCEIKYLMKENVRMRYNARLHHNIRIVRVFLMLIYISLCLLKRQIIKQQQKKINDLERPWFSHICMKERLCTVRGVDGFYFIHTHTHRAWGVLFVFFLYICM